MKKMFFIMGFSIILNPFYSCNKVKPHPVSNIEGEVVATKVNPWIIGLIIILKVTKGQPVDVTYYPNGQLKSYSCPGLGQCHIKIHNPGDNEEYSTEEALYGTDITLDGFVLVPFEETLLLGCRLDNPRRDDFFYSHDRINIGMPYRMDNLTLLSKLGISNVITIQGDYDVTVDDSRKFIYIRL
jgi:hypothetical protein